MRGCREEKPSVQSAHIEGDHLISAPGVTQPLTGTTGQRNSQWVANYFMGLNGINGKTMVSILTWRKTDIDHLSLPS